MHSKLSDWYVTSHGIDSGSIPPSPRTILVRDKKIRKEISQTSIELVHQTLASNIHISDSSNHFALPFVWMAPAGRI
jgi:hypothetical protein